MTDTLNQEGFGSQVATSEIRKTEYKNWNETYRGIMGEGKGSSDFTLDEHSRIELSKIPEENRINITDFAAKVLSNTPESVFTNSEYYPINRERVMALVASVYQKDQPAHTDLAKREMYIRALSVLLDEGHMFSTFSEGTEAVTQRFFAGPIDRASMGNYLIQMLCNSMPIASSFEQSRIEHQTEYTAFIDRTRTRLQKATEIYRQLFAQVFSGRQVQIGDLAENLIFVNSIDNTILFSNDESISSLEKYHALSANAIAYGVDPVTGLTLTLNKLPWDYDKIAKEPNLEPKDDASYKETLTIVHEKLHNTKPEGGESKDEWHTVINELLTDATANLLVLRTEGQSFTATPDAYRAITGYVPLVDLAVALVSTKLISEDELNSFGFHQDPKGFLSLLDGRIKNGDIESIKRLYRGMMARFLIQPRKRDKQEEGFMQFKASPVEFMRRECMNMWSKLGNQYLGMKYFALDIFEQYRQNHPEVGEKDYSAVRDDAGVLKDEAIDIFNNIFSKERRGYIPSYVDREFLEARVQANEDIIDCRGMNIPEALKPDPEDKATIAELALTASRIIKSGTEYTELNYPTEEDKLKLVVETCHKMYEGIVQTLEKNWGNKGINYTRGDVLSLIATFIPAWFRNLYLDVRTKTPDEAVLKVIGNFEGLTAPVLDEAGNKHIPTYSQITYWGRALV